MTETQAHPETEQAALLAAILQAASNAHTMASLGQSVHDVLNTERYRSWMEDPSGAIWR